MRLKQKFALILAATMLATAMPAMASSDNRISHMPVVGKDALVGFSVTTARLVGGVWTEYAKPILNTSNVPVLNVEYSDSSALRGTAGTYDKDAFVIKLTDGEFNNVSTTGNDVLAEKVYTGAWVQVDTDVWRRLTAQSDAKQLLVEISHGTPNPGNATKYITAGTTLSGLKAFDIPLYIEAKGATPTAEIISDSGRVSSGKIIVGSAATTDARASVTVADAEKFYEKGKLAKITILENYVGAFSKTGTNNLIKVSLEHGDFTYDLVGGDKLGSLTRGNSTGIYYGSVEGATVTDKDNVTRTANAWLDSRDKDLLWIKVPSVTSEIVRYALELDGIKVYSRKPDLGTFDVTVSGDMVDTTTVKVAEIIEYGIKLSVKDDKIKDVKAGRSENITFSFEELIEDSMTQNRAVEFKLENGVFMKGLMYDPKVTSPAKLVATDAIDADKVSKIDKELTRNVFIKDYIKKLKSNNFSDIDIYQSITALVYDGKDVIGFEFVPTRKNGQTAIKTDNVTGTRTTHDKDKFTFEDVKVSVKLDSRDKENVKLTVTGTRMYIGDPITLDTLKIIDPVKVEFTALTAKVGLKAQEFADAKVTITETEKGVFKRSEELIFDIDDNDGIKFSADPVVTVKQGTVKLVEKSDFTISKSDGIISITIKRASSEPASIELSGIKLDIDRTVPQGSYDLKIKGKALADPICGDLTVKEFIKIGTPNTEDITNNGLRKGVSVFTIGSSKYVVNAMEKEMDAAAYIEGASTMLPIRYVSEALGVNAQDILFSSGKVTIVAGNRTIQLANGSNVAVLNGAQVAMAQKAIIKDGRTYVPVGEIARLLGVKVEWDNSTKTAKFINE